MLLLSLLLLFLPVLLPCLPLVVKVLFWTTQGHRLGREVRVPSVSWEGFVELFGPALGTFLPAFGVLWCHRAAEYILWCVDSSTRVQYLIVALSKLPLLDARM